MCGRRDIIKCVGSGTIVLDGVGSRRNCTVTESVPSGGSETNSMPYFQVVCLP